jgi:hypothetical protein
MEISQVKPSGRSSRFATEISHSGSKLRLPPKSDDKSKRALDDFRIILFCPNLTISSIMLATTGKACGQRLLHLTPHPSRLTGREKGVEISSK